MITQNNHNLSFLFKIAVYFNCMPADDLTNLRFIFDIMKNSGEKIKLFLNLLTMMQLLLTQNLVELAFQLLSSGLLPNAVIKKLDHAKEMLADYIIAMQSDFFKKNALRDALDPAHPLGKLFNTYYFYSSLVQKFKIELNCLETKDKQRWRFQFFPYAKLEEIDTYLYLIDPYQPKQRT